MNLKLGGRGMTEPIKCPFCGGDARAYSCDPYDGYQGDCTVWRVQCYQCRAIIQRKTREKAIADWNRRAE